MNISQNGIDLIKHFEGCELEAYKCPAGVWTIGYGHTKGIQPGMVITEETANDMLVEELAVSYTHLTLPTILLV